jgi:hypothetical protein
VALYNKKMGQDVEQKLYGAVTTGTEWCFLEWQNREVCIDDGLYSIKNLPELLGILNTIVLRFLT